jgi:hypothetical protein
MKKLLLSFLIVASALLISVGGATAAAPPTQRGHSPNYIFDVTYEDTVVGEVRLNMAHEEPTFALVADGLTPKENYTFGYSTDSPVSVTLLGSADTSKSGSLRLRGTVPAEDVTDLNGAQFWVMATPPASSYYEDIVGLRLFNWGWVIAQIQAYYSTDEGVTWQKSGTTDNILRRENDYVDLGDLGVPEGALVKIHVIVIGAKDKTGSEVFRFTRWISYWGENETYAAYEIYGTAFKPGLQYWGLYEPGEACP